MQKSSIVIGALAALGAVALAASSKKEKVTAKAGETWHYVYAVYPDIPSKEAADQAEAVLKAGMMGNAIVTEFDASSNPNTIDITIKYLKTPSSDIAVGTSAEFGGHTLTLTEKDRVA